MSFRVQALILIVGTLVSLLLSRVVQGPREYVAGDASALSKVFAVQNASLMHTSGVEENIPIRNWNVLDPTISARAAIVELLPQQFPLFHYNTSLEWPIASLTKMITASVLLENGIKNDKIPISSEALVTEGEAGNLTSGEIYNGEDLLKIMLLTSSNDAAAAFEEAEGGRDKFVARLNEKTASLGMTNTQLFDASGLSDSNRSTASDLLRFMSYAIENHSELFSWTRLESILVQPLNTTKSATIMNINALVRDADFLGGKTGTSPAARENLAAAFSFKGYRILMILLGSANRVDDAKKLKAWIEQAYSFQ